MNREQLVTLVIAEVIQALGEVPSGHLYARVMGHMDLQTYERVIDVLIGAGVVTRKNHLLTWTGPKVKES